MLTLNTHFYITPIILREATIRSRSEKSRDRYKLGTILRNQHELSETNKKMASCPDEARILCLLLPAFFTLQLPTFYWKAQITEENGDSIRNVFSLVVKSKQSCF
ncbi:hypothetical protein AVEN_162097-1 [Araneus ventricosus]|uniref:Uncharacterized protein n=1 Tax=Araneus ventricosus TaxID=182803 RepID=A0A4Y2LIH0_ARAVE|nr:hypothetical protein AVEN_162097-1 [Araneus ventricosus]